MAAGMLPCTAEMAKRDEGAAALFPGLPDAAIFCAIRFRQRSGNQSDTEVRSESPHAPRLGGESVLRTSGRAASDLGQLE
jgi:hypothetical protein